MGNIILDSDVVKNCGKNSRTETFDGKDMSDKERKFDNKSKIARTHPQAPSSNIWLMCKD
jgi:hypothetical protein